MAEWKILLLGAIAGGTIFLGLPIGRMKRPAPRTRQFLNALAIGILLFLVWDVLSAAFRPLDTVLGRLHDGTGGVGVVLGYSLLFFAGLGIGLMGLIYYERFLHRQGKVSRGPGAMASQGTVVRTLGLTERSATERLAFLIAIGIGLHNFAEGLAIGQSAATGAISLATVLVIGFALHNATEGFGVVAPMASASERPSWGLLGLLGVIAGGPTLLGTLVGSQFTSEPVSVVFLTLAAGSILFVVLQLLKVAFKAATPQILGWGILAGLMAGFITDMVVTAGGA